MFGLFLRIILKTHAWYSSIPCLIKFLTQNSIRLPLLYHCTTYFDHRYPLCRHLYCTDDSTYTQNTLHHIISSVAFLRFWRCARLHSGGKDEPVWLGVILRYLLPKLSWRRRQHDAFRSKVFWSNVIFPTTLTFPGNLCCSRYAVVRLLHPVNHKLPLAPRPGVPRG